MMTQRLFHTLYSLFSIVGSTLVSICSVHLQLTSVQSHSSVSLDEFAFVLISMSLSYQC